MRGETYEGSQDADQTTGGHKEDKVLVMPLCQELAAKMPGKLRHAWTRRRHGSERQQWGRDCHRPGLPTLLPVKDLVRCKKAMGNHSFSSVARLRGCVYTTYLFAFPESRKNIFWWRRRIFLIPDYICRSNLCLSIVMISVYDACCTAFPKCIRAALLNQPIFTCSVRKVSSYFN